MPYASTPPERVGRAHAFAKRRAAERREREAKQLRAEADELDRRWFEYKARQIAEKQQAAS
jgi:hypothetical protein